MADETENKVEGTEVDEAPKTDDKVMTDEEINSKAKKMMDDIKDAFKCRSGIGFLPGLALLFIALKLSHVIALSWWWVLAPLYPAILVYGLVFIFMVLLTIVLCATEKTKK